MSVTMSRLNLVKGVGPVLQIAEGALPCQAAEPLSAEPVSIEIGIGNGHLQMQMLAIDVDVQRNLFGPVAVMSLSQIDVSAWDRDPTRNYLVVNHLNLLQMAGIGAAVRVGWFAPGIFFLAGGRYYHSRAEVRGIIEPVLVTDRFLPEAGVLGDIDLGGRDLYFHAQLYYPLTPARLLPEERNTTITLGVGFPLPRSSTAFRPFW